MRHSSLLMFLILPSLFLLSCTDGNEEILIPEKGEEFPGGQATVFDLSVNAFGNAAPNLTGDKDLTFVSGNSFFKRNWVTAPSSTEDLDGLGPVFNARSCSSCHLRDGRGRPPLPGEEETLGLLFRLSIAGVSPVGAPLGHPVLGGQFNPRSVLGVEPEGKVNVTYVEVAGSYPDGETYSLRMPLYEFITTDNQDLLGAEVSPRVAQHLIGLGLLEAISEQDLSELADPEDLNEDGISGRMNRVWDYENEKEEVGRFGWKANQPSVRQQVAAAFNGDIGITSSIFPNEPCGENQEDCLQALSGGEPELREGILDRVVLYSQVLAVPKRRNWDQPDVLKGKKLFNEIGCGSCHVSRFITGKYAEIPEFSNQTIRPYTDLLLHDMGDDLADNSSDFLATGTEWRTPPLWGLGMLQIVNKHTFLLHDGRARGFEEAVLWHGGEGQNAKEKFKALQKEDRESIIKFLESL